MENTCQNCGCKDTFLPVAPCINPTECPTPQKCEESFDSACVIYTGLDLSCGEDVIIATNTSIEDALQNIIDKICNPSSSDLAADISIIENQLIVNVTGGVAPYQYLWSIEQGLFIGHTISGANNLAYLTLSPIPANTLQVGGPSGATGAVSMSHIELQVTDSNSNIITTYYTYALLFNLV